MKPSDVRPRRLPRHSEKFYRSSSSIISENQSLNEETFVTADNHEVSVRFEHRKDRLSVPFENEPLTGDESFLAHRIGNRRSSGEFTKTTDASSIFFDCETFSALEHQSEIKVPSLDDEQVDVLDRAREFAADCFKPNERSGGEDASRANEVEGSLVEPMGESLRNVEERPDSRTELDGQQSPSDRDAIVVDGISEEIEHFETECADNDLHATLTFSVHAEDADIPNVPGRHQEEVISVGGETRQQDKSRPPPKRDGLSSCIEYFCCL